MKPECKMNQNENSRLSCQSISGKTDKSSGNQTQVARQHYRNTPKTKEVPRVHTSLKLTGIPWEVKPTIPPFDIRKKRKDRR